MARRTFAAGARRADVTASFPITEASLEATSMDADAERALRRSLGPPAWAVLAELHLDAVPGGTDARVGATSARRIAAQLGISKDTAARALRRRTAAAIVRRRPQATSAGGRFALAPTSCCWSLPPSASPQSGHGQQGSREDRGSTSQPGDYRVAVGAAVAARARVAQRR